MQRLGLCCLFIEAPIRFRTTTARYVSTLHAKGKDPLEHLSLIIQSNLENLLLALDYCASHRIGAFRINSGLLPIYTHPDWGYELDTLPNAKAIFENFEAVKDKAQHHHIRLTFHPDQYVVLNSPSEEVVEKSLRDLEYHGLIATLVGADVINIHGGGGYGDKPSAIKRFEANFVRLSETVQNLLTVENDDRVYTLMDLLPLCHELNIPLVYDVHHHRCLPDDLSVDQATAKALKTWDKEPLFHISSPKEGWDGRNPRLHHDFINLQDVPKEWKEIDPLTIDIEAKAKEVSVLKIQKELITSGWNLPKDPSIS